MRKIGPITLVLFFLILAAMGLMIGNYLGGKLR